MDSEPDNPGVAEFDDNPEWTAADFARARPAADVLPPALYRALTGVRGPGKRPAKLPISIRLSARVVEHYRSGGAGWQSRLNADLEKLVARKAK